MRVVRNDFGQHSVELRAGDDLDRVPDAFSPAVTLTVREAFADPVSYFRKIAAQTKVASFAKWLKRLTNTGDWQLVLLKSAFTEPELQSAFRWDANDVLGAFIAPPSPVVDADYLPPDLAEFYKTVGHVHWAELGCAGGLASFHANLLLQHLNIPSKSKEFPASSTIVFGSTRCGDALVYKRDGSAGFVSHENGQAYSLGTIREALEWIFSELYAGREPEFDYERLKRKR